MVTGAASSALTIRASPRRRTTTTLCFSKRAMQMNDRAPRVRVIEGRISWRGRALTALLRVMSRKPLRQDTDVAALRRRYGF